MVNLKTNKYDYVIEDLDSYTLHCLSNFICPSCHGPMVPFDIGLFCPSCMMCHAIACEVLPDE